MGLVKFSALIFQILELEIGKITFQKNVRELFDEFRLWKNMFRNLEIGRSICHQSIPPESAG